jgi:hydantoinase/carbamoylase family amidase
VSVSTLRNLSLDEEQEWLRERLEEFAALSVPGPGVTRLAYTPLERRAHGLFARYMRELGLQVWTDAAGNTIAERPGARPGLPALGTGSHLDSVPNAGGYDGIAGVVAAMAVARQYTEQAVEHAHPVRFVAFAAEEGARFSQACTGSRIVAGLTDPADLDTKHDADGVSLADAMRAVGLEPANAGRARWESRHWAAFIELHVEQGGVLESSGVPVGVVDVISGSTRTLLEITGRASHSGGTPMELRADAMTAAAEIILLIESIALDPRHAGTRATVGRIKALPGSITTIAGRTELYVDVRDTDSVRQRETVAEITERAGGICARRGVTLSARLLAEAVPTVLPGWLRATIARTCAEAGVDHRILPSGASHDSQMINRVVPAGMIFVPSRDGISHSPDEWTSTEQIAIGTRVLAAALLNLDKRA